MSALYTKQFKNRNFSILELSDSNIFKFEIISNKGANLEQVYKTLTNNNVYGGCHLIEHLGFKTTRDYSSEALLNTLKNNGSYNAGTEFERITYFYMTSMEHRELAINLTCNVAFNDFSKISEEEFLKEKDVVYNEVKRYHDDNQQMFWMNLTASVFNLDKEDNVLGTPETVNDLSFDDLKQMKTWMLTEQNHEYCITFDSDIDNLDNILELVSREIDSFQLSTEEDSKVQELYLNRINIPYDMDNSDVQTKTEQTMVAYVYQEIENPYIIKEVIPYISSLCPDVSLNDLIREKHGLTYGVSLYCSNVNNKYPMIFGCDVSEGNEELLHSLYEESIRKVYETFDEEKYRTYMKKRRLSLSMNVLDKKYILNYVKSSLVNKSNWGMVEGLFFEQAEKAPFKILELITFEVMRDTLKKVLHLTETKSYKVVTGKNNEPVS